MFPREAFFLKSKKWKSLKSREGLKQTQSKYENEICKRLPRRENQT